MSSSWGKQMWIWEMELCEKGVIGDIVSKAVDIGLIGLIVKSWDGSHYWSQLEQIIDPAKKAGLSVGAWGYSYGNDIAGEITCMEKAIASGADWLIIDAEKEYESENGKDKAVALAKALSSANFISKDKLAYSTYAFPSYHSSFPYETFSGFCSIAAPQIYWGEFKMSPENALKECLQQYEQYQLVMAPVGQSYGEVTPEEILAFGGTAYGVGAPGVSFWSWQHASSDMMDSIRDIKYDDKTRTIISPWAKDSWDKVTHKGIMDGTEPQGNVTREMLAVVLDRLGLVK